MDKPNNLKDMIESAVRIDNRFYKRFLERKGSYNFRKNQGNGKKKVGGSNRTRRRVQETLVVERETGGTAL
jgi:hypothetical protein